jgi:radical SAM superfamily enzyme YgiQ (UPF0313 family)
MTAKRLRVLLVRPRPHPQSLGLTDLITSEPLELEYLASVVQEEGHQAAVVDLILDRRPLAWYIRHGRPDVVMFTAYITHVNVVTAYAAQVKAIDPAITTVVGGLHAEVLPGDFGHPAFDVVATGGLEVARALLRHLAAGRPADLFAAPDVTAPRPLPLPDRTITARYRRRYDYAHHVPCALLKTSYGCPYSCRFCFCVEITGHRYWQRPMAEVAAELAQIEEPNVFLVDDNFLSSPARLAEFCRMLDDLGIHKRFVAFGRADFIVRHEDSIKLLADHGLDSLFVGIESFKQSELDHLDKRLDVAVSEQAARILHRHGVDLCAGAIVGPDWDRADFQAFVAWIRRMELRFVNIQPLVPLPATPVYEEFKDRLFLRREDYELWDLTHLSILPTKLAPSRYYWEMLKAYLRTTANWRAALYVWQTTGTRTAWKCLKGSWRAAWHYLVLMAQYRKVGVSAAA